MLGIRLPPDTEIIKYTSSIVGPKIPGTTNRGRKKTISLDPNPLLATLQGLSGIGVSPAKRARLEAEYLAAVAHQQKQQQQQQQQLQQPAKLGADYSFTKQHATSSPSAKDSGDAMERKVSNLSSKVSTTSSTDESDAPLNLCMKSSSDSKSVDFAPAGAGGSNSLQSLSSITAALGSGSGNDRMRE